MSKSTLLVSSTPRGLVDVQEKRDENDTAEMHMVWQEALGDFEGVGFWQLELSVDFFL